MAEDRPRGTRRPRPGLVAAVGVVALLGVSVAGVGVGPVLIGPRAVVAALADLLPGVHLGGLDATQQAIITQLRLPRVVLGLLVGALLAGCGAAYQGVFRNPLADPYLLGVAAGAGLGAVVAFALGWAGRGLVGLPLLAFAGALVAVALTYLLGGSGRWAGPTTLILAGVAVSAFLSAVQAVVVLRNSDQLQSVYVWLLGRLSTVGWAELGVLAPYAGVSLALLLLSSRVLDVLAVGDEEARTLGLRPELVRALIIAVASLATAAAVSFSGLIGFVGLVVPHLVRLLAGHSYRHVVPLAIVWGAALLVGADLVARLAIAPAELPIGVVTAFLGAPFFLLLLRLAGRRAGT